MKITVTGSLGNISRKLTEILVAKAHDVTVISHNPDKKHEIEALGAKAAIGSLTDEVFMSEAFAGAEGAYLMVPPAYDVTDMKSHMKKHIDVYTKVIKGAGVKYIANLSGIGAHLPAGMGPSGNFHYNETELNKLEDVNVLHMRAGMFYTNFYGNIDMIKNAGIIGNNYAAETVVPLIHPHDIAKIAADALDEHIFTGKQVTYAVSDEKNGSEVAAIFGEALGLSNLTWIEFTDEQLIEGATANGFSHHMASNFAEMGNALVSGKLTEHYNYFKPNLSDKIYLNEFAKDFAVVYNS